MSLVDEQASFLRHVCRLVDFATEQGFVVTGGELERKPEQQEFYVRTGRERSMDSMHLRKCAIDLLFFREVNGRRELVYDVETLKPVGEFWEKLDARNRWGGNWRNFDDIPHFERNIGPMPVRGADTVTPLAAFAAAPAVTAPVLPATAAVVPSSTPGAAVFTELRRGSSDQRSVVMLQTMLAHLGFMDETLIDGDFGPSTLAAVEKFQKANDLRVDGVVGEKSWTTLLAKAADVLEEIRGKWLGQDDIVNAAKNLQVEPACLVAVYKVEAGGAGFLGLRPKILFEGHKFWQRLQANGLDPNAYRSGNEDILYPEWTRQFYKGGVGEYERLERAMKIHADSALESASWGLFQIMGENWRPLGYPSVTDFVDKMKTHEREHLDAFGRFISWKRVGNERLVDVLKRRDWQNFALGYNGPRYRENKYDDKLAAAYAANKSSFV